MSEATITVSPVTSHIGALISGVEPDSVAFWNNRAVQHVAVWDYYPQTGSGNRVTITGDRPA